LGDLLPESQLNGQPENALIQVATLGDN
jgi:hypothetical protein